MESTLFRDILKQLECVDSEDQIKALCEAFCKASDYEYYIYAVIRSVTSLSSPQVHTYTNYPDEWFKSYLEEGMQKHDPVVKYCFENSAPICWNKLIQLESYVDPIGFKIMERAAELGLVNGISIPLKAPHGEMAIFSLATEKPEQTGEPLLEVLSHAQTLGTQLMAKVRRINTDKSESNQDKLTARELECIFWACEGKTTWEIAKIINVTERTVIFHFTSATKKLGAVNRQHAVARAIISGLIKPVL